MINIIAERIKELRKERGLSQSELAKKLGLTRAAINNWECATSLPSLACLVELSRFFHVSTDYMLGLSERTSIDMIGLSDEDIALISDIASRLKRECLCNQCSQSDIILE